MNKEAVSYCCHELSATKIIQHPRIFARGIHAISEALQHIFVGNIFGAASDSAISQGRDLHPSRLECCWAPHGALEHPFQRRHRSIREVVPIQKVSIGNNIFVPINIYSIPRFALSELGGEAELVRVPVAAQEKDAVGTLPLQPSEGFHDAYVPGPLVGGVSAVDEERIRSEGEISVLVEAQYGRASHEGGEIVPVPLDIRNELDRTVTCRKVRLADNSAGRLGRRRRGWRRRSHGERFSSDRSEGKLGSKSPQS
mmetsp:Transcript_21268/g.61904  ORF Transcript_21268/g.61904 Transcript_21268/m.61904 type:complete len:255 (-) Transcript_21268:88-852(-)